MPLIPRHAQSTRCPGLVISWFLEQVNGPAMQETHQMLQQSCRCGRACHQGSVRTTSTRVYARKIAALLPTHAITFASIPCR